MCRTGLSKEETGFWIYIYIYRAHFVDFRAHFFLFLCTKWTHFVHSLFLLCAKFVQKHVCTVLLISVHSSVPINFTLCTLINSVHNYMIAHVCAQVYRIFTLCTINIQFVHNLLTLLCTFCVHSVHICVQPVYILCTL